MSAGELLRETRTRHGLTQRELAIRARTSQAAVSRIERDVVSPSVSTLAMFLRLMNEELVLGACKVDVSHHDLERIRENLQLVVATRIERATRGDRPSPR